MTFRLLVSFAFACAIACRAAAADGAPPDALLLLLGDQHSAYDKVPVLVAEVDRLRRENPGVPFAVLINGDSFEYGNVLARRSAAEVDFAMFAALVRRGPTVLNLGNHEPDFHDPVEAVAQLQAVGVTVISGNARNRASDQPLAPAFARLKLGAHEVTIVGVVTSRLDTFRVAIRPGLDLGDPVVWARQNFPTLLKAASLPIVLSHSGIRVDREILPLVPDGTLFAGAHDHLRFQQRIGARTLYVHSGSWMEYYSLAKLRRAPGGALQWDIEHIPLRATAAGDADLAARVQRVREKHLTAEDTAVVGRLPGALEVQQAGRFAATALRDAAAVDTAFIGNTTFGAGLPAGDVTKLDFDACVRFDGPIFTATVDGARLQRLVAAANQGPDTPFEQRNGEFSFAGGTMSGFEGGKTYRIATTDWGAKNTDRYFGEPAIAWEQHPTLRLKAAVTRALGGKR